MQRVNGGQVIQEKIIVRRAVDMDIARVTEIYNHAVKTTTATYDLEPKSLESMEKWFRSIDKRPHGIWVSETNGNVTGFVALESYSPKAGYHQTAKSMVYIDEASRGQGLGTKLMSELIRSAKEDGMHTIIAGADSANEVSLKLHEKLGFVRAGFYKEVGKKFGKWCDVIWLQLMLN